MAMSDRNREFVNVDFRDSVESRQKALRKKFIYYGLAWAVVLFVSMDLFDAIYVLATNSGPPRSRVEPTVLLGIFFWVLYWYAALAWRLWLHLRKAPLDFDTYKWGLIGTWILISISAFGFYPVRYERDIGQGIIGLLLLGFVPAVLYSCIGAVVGILVYERTRRIPRVSDFHRIGIISLLFGALAVAVWRLPGPGAEPMWWQIAIMAEVTVGCVTMVIAVIARTLRSRAEFQFGKTDEEPPRLP